MEGEEIRMNAETSVDESMKRCEYKVFYVRYHRRLNVFLVLVSRWSAKCKSVSAAHTSGALWGSGTTEE